MIDGVRVYVAGALEARPTAQLMASWVKDEGGQVVSTWQYLPSETRERERRLTRDEAIARRTINHRELHSAHCVIVVSGAGKETFSEIEVAISAGIPVIWWTKDEPSLSVRAFGIMCPPGADLTSAIRKAVRRG